MTSGRKEIQQVCKTCGNKLVPLFYTVECNRCDKPVTGWFYRAYVLWTLEPDELWPVHEHPIFKWRSDCEIWKEKQYNPSIFEVRHILSYDKFFWTELPGTTLEVAGVYHKVYTNHRYSNGHFGVMILPRYTVIDTSAEQIFVDNELSIKLGLSK